MGGSGRPRGRPQWPPRAWTVPMAADRPSRRREGVKVARGSLLGFGGLLGGSEVLKTALCECDFFCMRVGGGVSRNGRRAFPRDLGAISRHEIAISFIVSCQRGAPNMMCASYNRKRNSALGPALLWLQCRCSGTSLGWEDAQAARGRVLGRVGQVSERCRFG